MAILLLLRFFSCLYFNKKLKISIDKKNKFYVLYWILTHTLLCDVEALPVAPYGLITEHALDRPYTSMDRLNAISFHYFNEISFHYFHPLTCPVN